MAKAATATAPAVQTGGLQCPYCLSNLRPERANIATGDVEGSVTGLRALPRADMPEAETPTTRTAPKARVSLSGKVDPDWSGKAKAGKK